MTFTQARWRLQLIAELGVGTDQRVAQHAEDARFSKLKEVTDGSRRHR